MNDRHQTRDGRIAGILFVIVVAFASINNYSMRWTDLAATCVAIVLIALAIGFSVSSIRHSSGIDRIFGFIVLGLFLLSICFGYFLSCLSKPDSRPITGCLKNIRQIGIACCRYSLDHDNTFPTSFTQITNLISNPNTFVCSISGHKPGHLALVDQWTDYVLVTNLSANSSNDLILAYCKPENHKGKGCNMVRVSGSAMWSDSEWFSNLTCNVKAHSRTNKRQSQQINAPYSLPTDGSK